MVGIAILLNYYQVPYLYIFVITLILLLILLFLFKKIKIKDIVDNDSDRNDTMNDEFESIRHNLENIDEEKKDISKLLKIYTIVLVISFVLLMILMIFRGFNFDYIYQYLFMMGLMFIFIILPVDRKKSMVGWFLQTIRDMVLYIGIILAILYLLGKYVLKII